VSDLQIEYSLASRAIEAEILPVCRELGIGITAYGVLSRGLLSGHWTAARNVPAGDFRAVLSRFAGDNLERNLAAVERLRALAAARGATTAQLAIAWVLARGADIVPLVGARRREQLDEALGALAIELDAEAMRAIEEALPANAVTGTRYPGAQMAHLDSERRA
jgi:aryl-alcohol dehydrogenase-like predicted oxidoreductase